MSKKIIILISVIVLLFGLALTATAAQQLFNLAGGDSLEIVCDGRSLEVERETGAKIYANCIAFDDDDDEGDNQGDDAGDDRDDDQDDPEPAPTDPPGGNIPLCPDHAPTAWHPLYDEGRNCHYDHEHKDNPHDVDDVFGADAFAWAGGELSYPWQTFKGAGEGFPQPPGPGQFENDLKHTGYGWLVRKNIASDGITDFRVQYHAIPSAQGAVTRFHSFWTEARACDGGRCGTVKHGGWLDYGFLLVDGTHVPLPGDPNPLNIYLRRIHATFDAPLDRSLDREFFWYGKQVDVDGDYIVRGHVALRAMDNWGNVNPANPSEVHFFCPGYQCSFNGSRMEAHIVAVMLRQHLDPNGDGVVNLRGYTSRHGTIKELAAVGDGAEILRRLPNQFKLMGTTCTAPGLDCVPLEIINFPVNINFVYRDTDFGLGGGLKDYDTSPPGQYWITYQHH